MKRPRRRNASILPASLATLAAGAVLCASQAAAETAQQIGDPKSTLVAAGDLEVADVLQRASQGEAEAQYRLGFRHCAGAGVQIDFAEAVKWFRKAAEQGYAPAQWKLACCYSSGFLGVTKDLGASAAWFRKAA
jgi:TPR repeat protein